MKYYNYKQKSPPFPIIRDESIPALPPWLIDINQSTPCKITVTRHSIVFTSACSSRLDSPKRFAYLHHPSALLKTLLGYYFLSLPLYQLLILYYRKTIMQVFSHIKKENILYFYNLHTLHQDSFS